VNDEAGRATPSRRAVVTAMGLLPLATLAPAVLSESQARAAAGKGYQHFSKHQAAVIKAACARLVPGPDDDPVEKLYDSPGATEADVVRYIDTMLAAFDHDPPKIFAGGPWSDRHGGDADHMKHFVPLAPRQLEAWRARTHDLKRQYAAAIKKLDAAASGKNFAAASHSEQDSILTKLDDERSLIFGHTIEGMYSVPEYGGNRHQVGWKSIGWPGDVQPRGFSPKQVEDSDGPDVLLANGVVDAVLNLFPLIGGNAMRKARHHG